MCVGDEGRRWMRKVKKNPPTPRKGKKTKSFIANESIRRKTEKVIYPFVPQFVGLLPL